MSLEWLLIKKYLSYDRTQPFISLTSILAFIGVALGVAVLMITMALTNGLSGEFKKKLFSMNYPLSIISTFSDEVDDDLIESLKKKYPWLRFSPYISEDALVGNGSNLKGVILYGVDFESEKLVNNVIKTALQDKIPKTFEVLMGKNLASEIYIPKSLKVKFTFTNQQASGFISLPSVKKFKVNHYYSSGLTAYDSVYVYTSLRSIRKITQKLNYDGVHIFSDNAFEDIKKLRKDYPNFHIIGWWEQNSGFFEAQQLEERALFIVLMIIILVASLNIISSLLITIMSRRKEIALLLSLGTSKSKVKKIFFLFGLFIGGAGIILGVSLGFLGIYLLETFNLIVIPAEIYGTSKLPMDLETQDFIYIMIGSISIILLSSIYPAYQASNVDVIDVLRYE